MKPQCKHWGNGLMDWFYIAACKEQLVGLLQLWVYPVFSKNFNTTQSNGFHYLEIFPRQIDTTLSVSISFCFITKLFQSLAPTNRKGHSAVVYRASMYIYGGYVGIRGISQEFWTFHFGKFKSWIRFDAVQSVETDDCCGIAWLTLWRKFLSAVMLHVRLGFYSAAFNYEFCQLN